VYVCSAVARDPTAETVAGNESAPSAKTINIEPRNRSGAAAIR
jgi:hypothetical protein